MGAPYVILGWRAAARAACESCPEFRVDIEHADAIYTLREVLDKL